MGFLFVECNVMEAAGTGFDKIVQDYDDVDEKILAYCFIELGISGSINLIGIRANS